MTDDPTPVVPLDVFRTMTFDGDSISIEELAALAYREFSRDSTPPTWPAFDWADLDVGSQRRWIAAVLAVVDRMNS